MKQQPMDDEHVADQAVERVVERSSKMVMQLVIKESKSWMVLEQAVSTAVQNRLDLSPVAGWSRLVLDGVHFEG